MKLSDQEQVILKAIGHRVVEVAQVIKAVGYPKATTKKVLVRLAEKGVVSLHRHDWPSSLTPAQRKLMVKIGANYYGAVSVRERNSTTEYVLQVYMRGAGWLDFGVYLDKDEAIEKAKGRTNTHGEHVRVIDGDTEKLIAEFKSNPGGKHLPGLPAKKQRQYEHILKSELEMGRSLKRAKSIAAGRVKKMARNPRKKIQYVRWAVDYIKPLYVYIKYEPDLMDMAMARRDAYSALTGEFGAHTHNPWRLVGEPKILNKLPADVDGVKGSTTKGEYWAWIGLRGKQNPKTQSKGKTALKATGKALKGLARGALSAGAQILGAGATALNPRRKRNSTRFSAAQWANEMARLRAIKPRPLHKLYGKSGGTPEQQEVWKESMKEWNRLYRHASKMQKIALEEDNAAFRAKQQSNPKRKRNAATTLSTAETAKRRAGASSAGRKAKAPHVRSVNKTRKASTRRATSKPLKKSSRAGTRRNTQRIVNNAKIVNKQAQTKRMIRFCSVCSRTVGKGQHCSKHPHAWVESIQASTGKRNPSAESIRKKFAGSVNGERDLFFPQGTPAGKLAKLGKLVSITTKAGTIKPVHGTAWLCADTRGKLHIGATSNAPLYSGPARNFGHVTKLEYESSKPHLGYGPTIWFHKAGEENGVRPTLRADGKGGLVFRGGAYRLTERGIEN